jgi:hypothetical protein
MAQPAPLYVIASPQPRVGKTLIARLLVEFFRAEHRPLVGYDLTPREPALAGRFPNLVWPIDISDTRGQMALFDRLIAANASTQIVDLGYGPFDQFFAIIGEIGFVQEARRRLIEPVILFVADPAAATVRSYAQLRRRLPLATFVPVHNESVSLLFAPEDFPPSRAECGVIRITRLSPIVRGVIDRPTFSFADYLSDRPGGPTEIHDWVGQIFAEFRQLELRLLLGRLSSSLTGAPAPRRATRRIREDRSH